MAHIRDFEPTLPNPQPYIEKALALYKRAVLEKRGRIVFIAAELGGGKTDLLNALAQALHRAKPEPTFVAGFFQRGEYRGLTLASHENVSLKKAVLVVGETASLVGFYPGLYDFAVSFLGQLLQTSASAHDFGNEFMKQPAQGQESSDWLRKFLRRTVQEKPVVCLLDDWDEAQRYYWDDMLLNLSRAIAQDLPLLLFITVKAPIDMAAPEKDESGLTMVIKTLTERGVADWWPLRKLSRDEVGNCIGPAAPGIAAKLHGVTSGNARWVQELWREWRLNEIVVMNEADHWVWGAQHKSTINLYEDILRDRLGRLLNAETAMGVEEAREVLACAALEGMRFTADAVALTLGWDRDDLIDFLDETLVQSEDNPDGILLEDDNVKITSPDGTTCTLWRYTFVSDLHWLALEHYGFANEQRPDKSDSERLEKSTALVKALLQTYAPDERLVAAPLARLLRGIGQGEAAQHYQRIADYSANREAMQEHGLFLLALNKDDWDQWRCRQTARFLIEAGKAMIDACSYDETRTALEEASKLAHRAQSESDEAYARYLCGVILQAEGDNKSARDSASDSLDIFSRVKKKSGIAAALNLLADIDHDEGRYDDARRHATQSLNINQELGNRSGTAGSLYLLAQIDCAEGRYDDARRHATRSLEIAEDIWDRNGTAISLNLLGEIDHREGLYDNARRRATQSLEVYQEIGNRDGTAASLHLLAVVDYAERRFNDARRHATQSLNIKQEMGHRNGTGASLSVLGQIDYADGLYDDARRHATQSLEIAQEFGDRYGTAASLLLLGHIARKIQRPKEALDLITLGSLILSEIGHAGVLQVQNDLAGLVEEESYSEEQLVEMNQQVLDAYLGDGGKELIENTLAGLRQGDR